MACRWDDLFDLRSGSSTHYKLWIELLKQVAACGFALCDFPVLKPAPQQVGFLATSTWWCERDYSAMLGEPVTASAADKSSFRCDFIIPDQIQPVLPAFFRLLHQAIIRGFD